MRKTAKIISALWRRDVVILALVVFGLSMADWFIASHNSFSDNPLLVSVSIEPSNNGTPDSKLPENMLPTGKPAHEPTDCFLVLPELKTDNNNGRLKIKSDTASAGVLIFSAVTTCRSIQTTYCLIDSDLGKQFTLVGSRPSGTS